MNPLKKLAGQTAIYGLSSIIGRFLNYLLVPLHTSKMVFSPDQYGIITELYSYVAFLVILLTYGMETSFFRFSTRGDISEKKVFSNASTSLILSSFGFILMCSFFSQPIANWLRYPDNNEFVVWFAIIVGLDAISSIPLARLRAQNKAVKFAAVNLISVFFNIGLNLFFLAYCLPKYQSGDTNWIVDMCYNPELGVSYVFISNLFASAVKFLLLAPDILKCGFSIERKVMMPMLIYGSPLLVAGLAGMINETLDRILLKHILFDYLGEAKTMSLIGIYGACYKISIIMTLFIQAFRYAAEPFFFTEEKNKGSTQTYADVMKWFVIICSVIFLFVLSYIDLIKYFIPNPAYWEGLSVVPILLMANLFLGIYYNLSVWYKLSGKTGYGALISIIGALITVVINLIFIKMYKDHEQVYMVSAWATLICYFSMVCISWMMGRKHYYVPYPLLKILGMLLLAVALFGLQSSLNISDMPLKMGINTLILLVFITVLALVERKSLTFLMKNKK